MDSSKKESEEETKPGVIKSAFNALRHVPGAALLFAVFPMIVLGYLGWFYYGADHLDRALYSLEPDNLSITAQPDWIKADVLTEVFQNSRLDRISLLDPSANATIAQAFETHNWVKAANRVTKSSGSTVTVDLVYRRPAAMVYYAAPVAPGEEAADDGFYPIDNEGVILPTQDFDDTKIWNYFMIFAKGARPAGDIGMAFGDTRISEALKLCSFLENDRRTLGLQEIWVETEPRSRGASPWVLTVVTKDQHRIAWGHAPTAEASGEILAAEKQQLMKSWLAQARISAGPKEVDLRTSDFRTTGSAGLPISSPPLK